MRLRLLYTVTFLFAFSFQGKCDTTDFYRFYYNNKVIDGYSWVNGVKTYKFKRSNISKRDTIGIEYIKDAPCIDCARIISVEDGENENRKYHGITYGLEFFSATNWRDRQIKISVADLVSYRENGNFTFDVYYFEVGKRQARTKRILVCKIQLE